MEAVFFAVIPRAKVTSTTYDLELLRFFDAYTRDEHIWFPIT